MKIKLADIDLEASTNHSREVLLPEDCHDLCISMSEYGQITPISVYNTGSKFILAAGFRRVVAATVLGWEEIDATLVEDEASIAAVNLIENIARSNLTYYQEIRAVESAFSEEDSYTKIGKALGKSRGWASLRVKPLSMGSDILQKIQSGELNVSNIAEILKLEEHEQEEAARRLADGDKPVKPAGRKHTRSKKELQRLATILMVRDKPEWLSILAYAQGDLELEVLLDRLE